MSTATHLSLHVTPSEDAMAAEAATIILEQYQEAIRDRGIFTIALSGGTTPAPLFRLLATPNWRKAIDWNKVEIYWVDERCVRPEEEKSHFQIVRKDLLSSVEATHFYRMKGEELPEKAAKDYEDMLIDHFHLQPGELPRFDCIILGVGKEGHTASLYPDDPAIRETKRLVTEVYNRKNPPTRLSLTLPVLNNARCCIFLATGRAKNHILMTALNLMAAPILPAQMVRPKSGKLCWIIDENAYQG